MDGYMPRDRREGDALDMYRVLDLTGAFVLALKGVIGEGAKIHPEMQIAMAAVMEALDDLDSEAEGLLKRYDPDRVLASTARRQRAAELLAQAREVLQPVQRDPDHATTSRRVPAAAE